MWIREFWQLAAVNSCVAREVNMGSLSLYPIHAPVHPSCACVVLLFTYGLSHAVCMFCYTITASECNIIIISLLYIYMYIDYLHYYMYSILLLALCIHLCMQLLLISCTQLYQYLETSLVVKAEHPCNHSSANTQCLWLIVDSAL